MLYCESSNLNPLLLPHCSKIRTFKLTAIKIPNPVNLKSNPCKAKVISTEYLLHPFHFLFLALILHLTITLLGLFSAPTIFHHVFRSLSVVFFAFIFVILLPSRGYVLTCLNQILHNVIIIAYFGPEVVA